MIGLLDLCSCEHLEFGDDVRLPLESHIRQRKNLVLNVRRNNIDLARRNPLHKTKRCFRLHTLPYPTGRHMVDLSVYVSTSGNLERVLWAACRLHNHHSTPFNIYSRPTFTCGNQANLKRETTLRWTSKGPRTYPSHTQIVLVMLVEHTKSVVYPATPARPKLAKDVQKQTGSVFLLHLRRGSNASVQILE